VSALLAALLLGMVVYLAAFSRLTHVISQDRLGDTLREQLREGTAPVSEGDLDGVLLADGAPVAQLRIPAIGVNETVVEGTTSGTLASGPGHRRDTMLPGQAGTSVLLGRAAAFGGPFGRLQELQPGDEITAVTGQGEHTFAVIGVRYAGDPAPAPIQAGESRLVLVTARGPAFMPSGVLRVDAELVSEVQAPGQRQTTFGALPAAAKEMGADPSHLWALVFVLQALVVLEVGAVWASRTVGARQAWIVVVPLGLLAALAAADQLTRLLPNLL
jgi:LPXTG-site transpeptidase (sortase) family protein